MKRREVVVGLGGAAVGWPLVGPLISSAAAQVQKPRLAMLLVAASETSPELGQRRDALAEFGLGRRAHDRNCRTVRRWRL